jgi:hypothetical protein
MLIGLVASGIFLSLGHVMAVIVLNIFIFLLILFIHTYFDNTNTSISIADIQKLRCVVERNGVSNA